MADNPIRAAAAAEGGLVQDTLLEAIVKRFPYTLNVGESFGDLDQASGEIILGIFSAATGYLYSYDATDSTTVDDGLTCLVDGSGHRYHIEDAASISISTVLAEQNAPPGSPTIGDSYIVGTAPTGAWAAHATDIALYTRRGWVFAVPDIGMTVYDQNTASNQQFDENGDWVAFAVEIADSSIQPVSLQFQAGLSVEAQQNTPASIDVGPHYLIGTSPTGAWAGHANKIAFCRDGVNWEFFSVYEGAEVYNKSTNQPMRFDGSSWGNVSAGIIDHQAFITPGAATWTKPAGVHANSRVKIQIWGAGGGGGVSNGGGGGGGSYVEFEVRASSLAATVAVNVGGGGTVGNDGSPSTFGNFKAWGGAAGQGPAGSPANAGGGGGGAISAGSAATGGNPAPSASSSYGGGNGGNPGTGGSSVFGGGGGGSSTGNGGASIFGGGGGGGGDDGAHTGGVGHFSGSGGASDDPGGAPAGGGGSNSSGGRGEIRVTVYN